jgi:hypothetical protein
MIGQIRGHSSRSFAMLSLLLTVTSLLPTHLQAARTKAIIPLYVDIERDPKAWDPLYKVYYSNVWSLVLWSSLHITE